MLRFESFIVSTEKSSLLRAGSVPFVRDEDLALSFPLDVDGYSQSIDGCTVNRIFVASLEGVF